MANILLLFHTVTSQFTYTIIVFFKPSNNMDFKEGIWKVWNFWEKWSFWIVYVWWLHNLYSYSQWCQLVFPLRFLLECIILLSIFCKEKFKKLVSQVPVHSKSMKLLRKVLDVNGFTITRPSVSPTPSYWSVRKHSVLSFWREWVSPSSTGSVRRKPFYKLTLRCSGFMVPYLREMEGSQQELKGLMKSCC